MGLNLDWENMEDGEHFPTQENHSGNRYRNCENLAEVEAAYHGIAVDSEVADPLAGAGQKPDVGPPRDQAQDIQSREAKNQHPENVVDIPLLAGKVLGELEHEEKQ